MSPSVPRRTPGRNPGLAVRALAVGLAGVLAAGCARNDEAPPSAAQSEPAIFTAEGEAAEKQITAQFLSERIATLSGDDFEGRLPATAGDRKTQAWLAAELKAAGFEPGGPDGAWEQPFDIVGIDGQLPKEWTFRAGGKRVSAKWWDEYVASSGVQAPRANIRDAELVFVGYGIQAPEFQWDDFKGQDLKGKVLVMLNSDPDWDPALFGGVARLYYGRWSYKYESAARAGAAGAIIVHTTPSAGYPWQVVQTSWSGEQFELPAAGEPRIQVAGWVTEDMAQRLASLGGHDLAKLVEAARSRDFQPVPLGVTTSLAFTNKIARKSTANVAGLLRGSDPTLASEVVVYSAHHDHLGVGQPDATGDRIYNGAVDNASGVAQVLSIARAFQALPKPPRRSVLVLFVAAEEQGLLGSEHYALHPTFAPGRIAANINYDGGNVHGKARDLAFVGYGKSSLDQIVERIAVRQQRVVTPDAAPDRGFFYRSDQFNFAKIGVPAFYRHHSVDYHGKPPGWGREQIEDWEEHRYHQPSDELDPAWVYDGMIEDAQVGFWLGLTVANADGLPSWKPGDEFEAARKAALAAVSGSADSPANTGP